MERPTVLGSAAPSARTKDTSKLAAGAGVSLTGKLLGRGIHVLGQVLLARLLGPAAFGLYAIGWTLLRVIGLIAPLGLDAGVIRYAPRYWRSNAAGLRSVLVQSLGWGIFSGTAMGVALFFSAPALAERVFQKPELAIVIRLFALAFPLMTGLRVAAAATRVTKSMKYSVYAMELGQPTVNLVLVVAMGLVGLELWGAVTAAVVSFAVAFAMALYYVRRLQWSGIGSPLWGVLIASVVFPASLWLVGLDAEDREVVDLVRARMASRGYDLVEG